MDTRTRTSFVGVGGSFSLASLALWLSVVMRQSTLQRRKREASTTRSPCVLQGLSVELRGPIGLIYLTESLSLQMLQHEICETASVP